MKKRNFSEFRRIDGGARQREAIFMLCLYQTGPSAIYITQQCCCDSTGSYINDLIQMC